LNIFKSYNDVEKLIGEKSSKIFTLETKNTPNAT